MSDQINTDAIRALTWDKITAYEVADLLNEVDRLRADRDRLASLFRRITTEGDAAFGKDGRGRPYLGLEYSTVPLTDDEAATLKGLMP